MTIAAKAIAAIIKAGFVQNKTQLAKKLGTWSHIIKAIEDGTRSFTNDQIQTLCNLYDVDARYFFGQSENVFLTKIKS